MSCITKGQPQPPSAQFFSKLNQQSKKGPQNDLLKGECHILKQMASIGQKSEKHSGRYQITYTMLSKCLRVRGAKSYLISNKSQKVNGFQCTASLEAKNTNECLWLITKITMKFLVMSNKQSPLQQYKRKSVALEQYCTMQLHSTHTSTWMVEVELAQMLKHARKKFFFHGFIFY